MPNPDTAAIWPETNEPVMTPKSVTGPPLAAAPPPRLPASGRRSAHGDRSECDSEEGALAHGTAVAVKSEIGEARSALCT